MPAHSVLQSSTKTGAKWLLHFQDAHPPQEIQFKLEQRLMTLMPPRMEAGKLVCSGKVKIRYGDERLSRDSKRGMSELWARLIPHRFRFPLPWPLLAAGLRG